MEQEIHDCEESIQTTLDFKCKKILPDMEKSSVSCSEATEDFASPTPKKPTELPRRAKVKEMTLSSAGAMKQTSENSPNAGNLPVVPENRNSEDLSVSELPESSPDLVRMSSKDEAGELPDKYKMLAEFFDRMVSSIRLLCLRKKLSTFQNICSQVEILTKRKFLYSHLAQIKYILPEAVKIKKILTLDMKTLCMIPDMEITLLWDVLKDNQDHKSSSLSVILHQVFLARLLAFFKDHPEGCEIPEGMLPEPFNQGSHIIFPPRASTSLTQETAVEPLPISLHLPPSFKSHFSQKTIIPEAENTPICSDILPDENSHSNKSSSNHEFSVSVETSTPLKPILTPDQLILETPVQKTPKRSMLTPDDVIPSEKEKSQSSATKRSLNFSSHTEADGSASEPTANLTNECPWKRSLNGEMTGSLSATLLKSVHEEVNDINDVHEMGQTGLKRRQQVLACLPDLFNMICSIFRSANRSSFTKQELLHKIIAWNCEIVENSDVEEQLELLEELAPDWICGKVVTSGDFLYCIKKTCDPASIRSRLLEAV